MISMARRYYWLLIAAACFGLVYGAFLYDTQRESTATRQLRKADICVSIEELKARFSSEPKEENGAFLYLQAMDALRFLGDAREDDLPIAGFLEYQYGQPLTIAQRETLHAYVALNEPAINLILEAQKYSFFRLPESRYDTFEADYLAPSRGLGRLLSCAALDAALSGDTGVMDRMVTAGLRLPEVLSEGGLLIHTLVAKALRSIVISGVQDCLYYVVPAKETLRGWLHLLRQEQYTTFHAQQDAFRNETSLYSRYFTSEYPYLFGVELNYRFQLLGMRMASEWTQYNYFTHNQYIQIMKAMISLADEDPYIAVNKAEKEIEEASTLWGPRYVLNAILLPAHARIYSSYVRGMAEATTARTALASLLYREDHGQMPESLEALVPDYLPAPPRDPFTPDGVLRYKVTDAQAIFYSVGPDQEDNGGTEPEQSILQDGDIIFRVQLVKPAT